MTSAATPDVSSTSLSGKVRRGLWWGLIGGAGQQLASVLTTVVLVRLLAPSEFGVVVAANVVVAMVGVFTYLGIRLAVVRTPALDEVTLWTLFWLSTALGVLTSTACVALAPAFAAALGQPEATPFLRVLGALILVQTLGGVPRALLQRDMRFKAVYGVELLAAGAQCGAAVVAALSGLGAWSLVLGYAAHAVVLLLGYWGVVRRRPRLLFSRSRAREQLRFGAGMWTNSTLMYVVRNADYWAVSRALGSGPLGVYYVAYVLPNVLRQRLTWVTGEVMLPSFAGMQHDLARLRRVYARSVRLHVTTGVSAMTGLAVVSPAVVEVFFGSRWSAAVLPMSLVCLAAAAEFVTQPATGLLVALGHTRQLVGVQLGRAAVLVPGVFLVVEAAGLAGVAGVVLVSALVTTVHAQVTSARQLGESLSDTFKTLLPGITASAAMAGCVLATGRLLGADAPALLVLPAQIAVGTVTYPLALWLLAPAFARGILADLLMLAGRSR